MDSAGPISSVRGWFAQYPVRPTSAALIAAIALAVAACGGGDGRAQEAGREPTPDPKHLVAQLSDLPAGFSLVPGERFRTRLANVLADPWSAGHEDLIRRERVAGYQTAFWSPESGRIECAAAVYRSSRGAGEVFRLRNRGFEAFLAAGAVGRATGVERIGDQTKAYRYEIGHAKAVTVAWRYQNVLASCTALGLGPDDLRQIVGVALAQQQRIAGALG